MSPTHRRGEQLYAASLPQEGWGRRVTFLQDCAMSFSRGWHPPPTAPSDRVRTKRRSFGRPIIALAFAINAMSPCGCPGKTNGERQSLFWLFG